MALSGKYDYSGIKKAGALGVLTALGSTAWAIKLFKFLPFSKEIFNIGTEFTANWLANHGLIVLNVAWIPVESKFDQKAFDLALSKAFDQIENHGVTPEQGRKLDEEVKAAARKFFVLTGHNKP